MHRYAPAALILVLLIAFRYVGSNSPESFPNFQPLAALFYCGALLINGWKGWAIPLGAWLITYPIPALLEGNANWITPGLLFVTGSSFVVTYMIGSSLRSQSTGILLVGSLCAALAFHIITNTLAWAFSPLYAKTLLGLWQSLWLGPAISEIPSWVFLRNMITANLLFTTIFLSARFSFPKILYRSAPEHAR